MEPNQDPKPEDVQPSGTLGHMLADLSQVDLPEREQPKVERPEPIPRAEWKTLAAEIGTELVKLFEAEQGRLRELVQFLDSEQCASHLSPGNGPGGMILFQVVESEHGDITEPDHNIYMLEIVGTAERKDLIVNRHGSGEGLSLKAPESIYSYYQYTVKPGKEDSFHEQGISLLMLGAAARQQIREGVDVVADVKRNLYKLYDEAIEDVNGLILLGNSKSQ